MWLFTGFGMCGLRLVVFWLVPVLWLEWSRDDNASCELDCSHAQSSSVLTYSLVLNLAGSICLSLDLRGT